MTDVKIEARGLPKVTERLAAGQRFNAYETTVRERFSVGIGPVTDFLQLTACDSVEVADLLADALRIAFGQPSALARLSEQNS